MLQEKIINSLVEQIRGLLEDHWSEAERMFNGQKIKINAALTIELSEHEADCKAAITFGARIKDSIEATVSDQPELLPKQ
jgi:hypothetical protein